MQLEMEEDESSLLLVVADPQVTSTDPNERKLARQLRIGKRKDAVRRATNDGDGHHVDIYSKTELEQQVEESAEELERLLLDGKELVTNVRVASDTREVNRRQEETENRVKRLKRLEEDENTTRKMFEDISEKWEIMSAYNDPMDLKTEIDAQKEKCNELLSQKNAVISDLLAELESADERFVKDQQRQMKEVSLLVQRIESQVQIMREAYRRELQLIEDAICNERRELLETCNKHWDSLYKQRDKEEVNMLSLRFQEQESQEDEIKRIRMEHQEKYRQTKIKLDTDIQVMHHELEQVKAMCLLNSEKLDYNYQVLQKREDENLMMRAQQKRRINKLQDIANNLRKKLRESEAAADLETARLHEEISRLHQNITDIEKKANHFAEINDRRYHQVWDLHQDTANKLVEKIMTIDRLIHEQQLGLEWIPPDNVLIDKEDLPSFNTAMNLVKHLFPKEKLPDEMTAERLSSCTEQRGSCSKKKIDENESDPLDSDIQEASKLRLLKLVLQRVADGAGFLVEDRLQELLAPYSLPQQTIIRLDNVFNALGLRYESDIEMLRDFFLPYAVCTLCNKSKADDTVEGTGREELFSSDQTRDKSESLIEEIHKAVVHETGTSSSERGTISSLETAPNQPLLLQKQSADLAGSSFPSGASMLTQLPGPPDKLCCASHPLEINPVYVLQALRSFVSKFQNNQLRDLKSIAFLLSQKRNTVSRLLSVDDVTKFWDRFQRVFPKKRERLWEGFLIALHKYHTILCERHKLSTEAKSLSKQNAELRRLLEGHMGANDPIRRKTLQGGRDTLPPLNQGKNMNNKSEQKVT